MSDSRDALSANPPRTWIGHDRVHTVSPTLAGVFGIPAALFLERLHAELMSPDLPRLSDGRRWSPQPIAAWEEDFLEIFPRGRVGAGIRRLESLGIVVRARFDGDVLVRIPPGVPATTLIYRRIDHARLAELRATARFCQPEPEP